MKPATAKGASGRGRSLKIRRTPAGGAGVMKLSHHSAESAYSSRPPPCRRPLRIRAKNVSFLHAKTDPKRDPFWEANSMKIVQKCRPERNIKKTFNKLAKMMRKRKSSVCKNKHFAVKACICSVLRHLQKSAQNNPNMNLDMTPNSLESLPEAYQKRYQQ